jgi:hypothetical protein
MINRPDIPPPVMAEPPQLGACSEEPAGHSQGRARQSWVQRLSSVLFIVFCFEVGLFLLVYPWTESWSRNYFSWLPGRHLEPAWRQAWNNTYVRGAVSGLGAANLWIALGEVFRLFSSRHRETDPRERSSN